jgi:hypothetical protein
MTIFDIQPIDKKWEDVIQILRERIKKKGEEWVVANVGEYVYWEL